MAEAYLGLGSNLGDRCAMLDEAVRRLARHPGISVVRVAAYRETAPVDYLEQGNFINTAVAVNTSLSPLELLETVQQIEAEFGRKREVRFGPRTLDIDILLYGDLVVDGGLLVLPHPRLHEREFVLVPLAEIAPQTRIPPDDLTVKEMLTRFYRQRRP
ncbi:MAG: 2-amino-4-hydroxy-6-hydroxymethyldihydropteridine pyrophosphokinase [Syntrophomonadaceae bacterium]|nr:2-amino-4-hydroxy-6-hydroxymethyldihydropteridine pyrophosphokinase [Bacillota bacterium]